MQKFTAKNVSFIAAQSVLQVELCKIFWAASDASFSIQIQTTQSDALNLNDSKPDLKLEKLKASVYISNYSKHCFKFE